MPHITLPAGLAGMRALLTYQPATGRHLYTFTQELLRGESPLTPAERELMATYVSSRSECVFCTNGHAAAARELLGEARAVVDAVIHDVETAPLSPKMRALLQIAGKVWESGRAVTDADIAAARAAGAGDRDIHDTVLIAAAFNMFNRYVDGLASSNLTDPKAFEEFGKRWATVGYKPLSATSEG
jgi:uncharacterized peroxidase-related enzyme